MLVRVHQSFTAGGGGGGGWGAPGGGALRALSLVFP